MCPLKCCARVPPFTRHAHSTCIEAYKPCNACNPCHAVPPCQVACCPTVASSDAPCSTLSKPCLLPPLPCSQVACCPTVASSDAPCSALSVVYTPDGVVDHIRYYKWANCTQTAIQLLVAAGCPGCGPCLLPMLTCALTSVAAIRINARAMPTAAPPCRRRHPNLILLDTSVIAAAPKRLLVRAARLFCNLGNGIVCSVHMLLLAAAARYESPVPHPVLVEARLNALLAVCFLSVQVAGIGDALATYFEVGAAAWRCRGHCP